MRFENRARRSYEFRCAGGHHDGGNACVARTFTLNAHVQLSIRISAASYSLVLRSPAAPTLPHLSITHFHRPRELHRIHERRCEHLRSQPAAEHLQSRDVARQPYGEVDVLVGRLRDQLRQPDVLQNAHARAAGMPRPELRALLRSSVRARASGLCVCLYRDVDSTLQCARMHSCKSSRGP